MSKIEVNEIVNQTGDNDSGLDLSTNDVVKVNIAGAEKARVDSSGRLLIGTTTEGLADGDDLTVSNSGAVGITIRSTDSGQNNLYFSDATSGAGEYAGYVTYEHGSDSMRLGTGGTERFRIQSSGAILIGNNAPAGVGPSGSQVGTAFGVGNYPYLLNSVADASTRYHHQFFNSNGSVGIISTNGSNTTYATSSDYRLKENVNYTWDGTTEIKKLKPCKFNFKADNTETLQGFLAHEVAEVVPNAVVGNKDEMRALSYYEDEESLPTGKKIGDVKKRSDTEIAVQSLDSSHLVPLLTKALQEALTRIETLEAKVTALEGA